MALLDSLLALVVFAAAAALLPVPFALQTTVLGAVLLGLWIGVEGRWSSNPQLTTSVPSPAIADIRLPDRTDIDPREIEAEPLRSIPSPPPSPPVRGRVVVSPLAIMEQGVVDSGVVGPPDLPGAGRNDPCWCGSGKKYKKCHGA